MAQKAQIKDNKAICKHCNTKMLLIKMKKYQGSWPWVLIICGIIAFFFIHFGGPIIGLPMLIFGVYMVTTSHKITMCPECGYYFKVLIAKEDPVTD